MRSVGLYSFLEEFSEIQEDNSVNGLVRKEQYIVANETCDWEPVEFLQNGCSVMGSWGSCFNVGC